MVHEAPGRSGSVLIIGASLAGLRTAESLRSNGFDGTVTIIGEEHDAPYDRPPLSKQFLAGTFDESRIALRVPEGVKLVTGTRAVALDVSTKTVTSEDEGTFSADAIVIATGTRVRPLEHVPAAQPVFVIRTLADSQRLRARLTQQSTERSSDQSSPLRVAVIGAGFIGSEVASTATTLGCAVTVIEAAAVPYERALGPDMGLHCASFHQRNGVTLICGSGVASIDASTVTLTDGRRIDAEVVVAGIGVVPNTGWLHGSGLDLSNGVLCDISLRVLMADGTRAEGIYAVGDVARWPNELFPLDGHPETMRVEHWTTAVEMGEHVGRTIASNSHEPFQAIPYFWSDQYGVKIQFLGRGSDADEVRVIDGPDDQGRLLALYRRGDRLSGVLGVSKMKALMGYRAHLAAAATWEEVLASHQS
jgi:NADPH-dependent 2,4-dienoyl-CoA reductase/sulfur reductase-like enzyme